MRRVFAFTGLIAVIIWVSSCAPTASVTSYGGPSMAEAQAERYDDQKPGWQWENSETKQLKVVGVVAG